MPRLPSYDGSQKSFHDFGGFRPMSVRYASPMRPQKMARLVSPISALGYTLLMFGAAVGLRLSKKPRSRGIGSGGSLPMITSNGGLSGPAAMSLATHSVVIPVTISTRTSYFFSNGSTSAFFITSDQRPP